MLGEPAANVNARREQFLEFYADGLVSRVLSISLIATQPGEVAEVAEVAKERAGLRGTAARLRVTAAVPAPMIAGVGASSAALAGTAGGASCAPGRC